MMASPQPDLRLDAHEAERAQLAVIVRLGYRTANASTRSTFMTSLPYTLQSGPPGGSSISSIEIPSGSRR